MNDLCMRARPRLKEILMDRSMARSVFYNTLSLCYVFPDEEVGPWLTEGKWVDGLEGTLKLLAEESLETPLFPINDILQGAGEEFSLELRREYTRLFINGFPHVVAPPCGSIYLEKSGSVFGSTTPEVLKFYHHAGFALKENLKDLPDHIAHEFEFMGILANQESQATGGEKIGLEEMQMNFFSRFIQPWVPSFCERIEQQSRIPFYRNLAILTQKFIDFEKNYLGIPEELTPRKEIVSERR